MQTSEDVYRLANVLAKRWKDRALAEMFVKERIEAEYKRRLQEAAGKVKVVK